MWPDEARQRVILEVNVRNFFSVAIGLFTSFAFPALSQTVDFNLNAIGDKEQTKLIVELAASNGADREYMIEQIPRQRSVQMDEFQYRRFFDSEVETINSAPTLWNLGETVRLSYTAVAKLKRYDFDSETYSICVPTMFVPAIGWIDSGRSVIPPNVLTTFSPANSSASETAPVGQRCYVDNTFWGYVGAGIGDFHSINVKMTADEAERLLQQSRNSHLADEFIEYSIKCLIGPGVAGRERGWRRTNGADCAIESGSVGLGDQRFNIERYNIASIRAAEESAVAEAAAAEATRIAELPEPTISACSANSNTKTASQFPNCEIITFTHGSKSYMRSSIGKGISGPYCLYVARVSGRVEWTFNPDYSALITPSGSDFPASAVAFEIPLGDNFGGFICGYRSIAGPLDGQNQYDALIKGLGDSSWSGKVVKLQSVDPIRLSIENGEIVMVLDEGCRYVWSVRSKDGGGSTLVETTDGPYCGGKNFVRVEFVSASQLNVEWRVYSDKGEAKEWAVLKSGSSSPTGTAPPEPEADIEDPNIAKGVDENQFLKQLIGEGVWSGSVSQRGSSTSYSVVVSYGEGYIEVEYPELGCGGTLEFVSKLDNNVWILKEKLNHGAGRCVDGGEVLLALSGPGAVRYEWARSSGKESEAWADLTYANVP